MIFAVMEKGEIMAHLNERRKKREQLYVFAVPNAMIDHTFNDDVAITWAATKNEAIAKFCRLYKDVKDEEVDAVRFGSDGVAILTDY